MAEGKVTPREDYYYAPQLPDFYQMVGAITGFSTMCSFNMYRRYPTFHKPLLNVPLFVGVGLAAGTFFSVSRERYIERKVRIAEAYIQENPELFVEPPKKKYKDVLTQWYPRR